MYYVVGNICHCLYSTFLNIFSLHVVQNFCELQIINVFPNTSKQVYHICTFHVCVAGPLGCTWTRHYCTYEKVSKTFSMCNIEAKPTAKQVQRCSCGIRGAVCFRSSLSVSLFHRMVSCQIPQRSSDWSPVLGGRLTRLINASVLISRLLKGGCLQWQHSKDVLKLSNISSKNDHFVIIYSCHSSMEPKRSFKECPGRFLLFNEIEILFLWRYICDVAREHVASRKKSLLVSTDESSG